MFRRRREPITEARLRADRVAWNRDHADRSYLRLCLDCGWLLFSPDEECPRCPKPAVTPPRTTHDLDALGYRNFTEERRHAADREFLERMGYIDQQIAAAASVPPAMLNGEFVNGYRYEHAHVFPEDAHGPFAVAVDRERDGDYIEVRDACGRLVARRSTNR